MKYSLLIRRLRFSTRPRTACSVYQRLGSPTKAHISVEQPIKTAKRIRKELQFTLNVKQKRYYYCRPRRLIRKTFLLQLLKTK